VVPIPGPSAVAAALSAAGVPADRFVFDGFLPVKPGRRVNRLRALRALETTVVLYESPHRIVAALTAIREIFGEAPLVLARELTKQFEEIVTATPSEHLERLAAGPIRGEFTLVIPASPPGDSDEALGAPDEGGAA
jgi:16S rRNA (cytidine1402-2'-O)-methyltransferase